MKRCVIVLALALIVAAPSMAQQLPKPTPAGERALGGLIERCVAAGGLRRVDGPQAGSSTLAPGDGEKLKAAVEAARADLTAALLDALIARWRVTEGDHESAVI